MEERALAHIERIAWIRPIEGADNIELVGIQGWHCIAKIGEFHEGDLAVYIEIDSRCPKEDERFAFLEKKDYKVKTMKLGKFNVISQGLALPLDGFPELKKYGEGSDVTEKLKITYSVPEDNTRKSNKEAMERKHPKLFSNPVVKKLMRYKWFRTVMRTLFEDKKERALGFPDWVSKTDELRIESIPERLEDKRIYSWTEKCDGTSGTYSVRKQGKKFDFAVCSRNHRLNKDDSFYWEMADRYPIEQILTELATKRNLTTATLQGEIVGESIQSNPYKMHGRDIYFFNLVCDGLRTGTVKLAEFCKEHSLHCVPVIGEGTLPDNMEDMKAMADGKSVLNPKVDREGLVYRLPDGGGSFKNVSNKYLLKHNE